MKKKTKKLVLAKETLRNLDNGFRRIIGGTVTDCCPYTADLTCTCGVSGGEQSCICTRDQEIRPYTDEC